MIRSNVSKTQIRNIVTEQVKMIHSLIFTGISTQHLLDFYSKTNIQIFIIHFLINSRTNKNFRNVQKWISIRLKCSVVVPKQTWMFSMTFVVWELVLLCHQRELFSQTRIIETTQAGIHGSNVLRKTD